MLTELTIPWNIDEIELLTCLEKNLSQFIIFKNVNLDYNNQKTDIIFDDNTSVGNNTISSDIIPNKLKIYRNTITYNNTKKYQINDFPQVLKFIEQNCPHIKRFMEDENITECELVLKQSFEILNSYRNELTQKLSDLVKKIEFLNNKTLCWIFVLIYLIQRFYIDNQTKLIIQASNNTLSYIMKKSPQYYDELINNSEILDNYNITLDSRCASSYDNIKTFKFADKPILRSCNLDVYANLKEIKFLDYISNHIE
jgi:hypothetical protein